MQQFKSWIKDAQLVLNRMKMLYWNNVFLFIWPFRCKLTNLHFPFHRLLCVFLLQFNFFHRKSRKRAWRILIDHNSTVHQAKQLLKIRSRCTFLLKSLLAFSAGFRFHFTNFYNFALDGKRIIICQSKCIILQFLQHYQQEHTKSFTFTLNMAFNS